MDRLGIDRHVPNKPRPRCPTCGSAMEPLFMKRERGESYARLSNTFACRTHGILAKGRRRTKFLT